MAYFDEVDPKPDFPEMERKILDGWYKKGVVKKYLARNKSSKKNFSFLDGPITANNPMGVHHAWGRTYKDLWQRFKNMQGYKQRFQNGFDCQGLWVEVEVEKELGLKSKKDIENLVPGDKRASIAKFVELCKDRVKKYAGIQTEQSKRLGYFMDWSNSYYTLSDKNNYMIWHFLKKCHEQGLIYKGRDSVPWCPRCGTAISQHEMLTEDYKELTHETVFFKLPIKNKDFSLLVWTTTPWTIPANVAVAVNPEFNYRVWKEEKTGDKIIFLRADSLPKRERHEDFLEDEKFIQMILQDKNWQKVTDYKGKDLVGLKYTGPFDDLPRVKVAQKENPKTFHSVVSAQELVVATKGTGILHVAPGAGEEDFKLGKEKKLSIIDVIDEEANYYDGLGDFSGHNAKKHPEIIIEYLKQKDGGKYLFNTENYLHRYPACWRCKTELVWRVVDEWYIAMDPLREPLKKVTKKINWIPKFGLKREIDWLDNMHDWLISKKRYWGLALPIWTCGKCGHFEVIGGKDELKEKAKEGWDKFEGNSPHKPWIDEVKINCEKCGGVMERIPDVGNPWLDAGIVSFSTLSADNKSDPLYLVGRKEFEKWYPVDFITESFPGQFKNWFYSLLAMSTVLEDREPFKTVLGFATLLGEDGRPMHKSWGNAIEFNEGADKIGVDVMRWMYVRQNPSENLLFGYHVADETRRRFHLKLWNVYNFFVTYANLDGWSPMAGNKEPGGTPLDDWILSRLSETIKDVTYFLEKHDAYLASGSLEGFLDDLSLWYIRRSRDRVGPAGESAKDKDNFYKTCHTSLVGLSLLLAPFTPFISEVIYRNLTKGDSLHLGSWPSAGKIDEKLIKQMSNLRLVVEKVHAIRKDKGIPVRQPLARLETEAPFEVPNELKSYLTDEVNVKSWILRKGKTLENSLDTKITQELEEEAKTRELIRSIQEERRKMGMSLSEKVDVSNTWLPSALGLVQRLKSKALIGKLSKGDFKVEKV